MTGFVEQRDARLRCETLEPARVSLERNSTSRPPTIAWTGMVSARSSASDRIGSAAIRG
jgi:hypothetical protein